MRTELKEDWELLSRLHPRFLVLERQTFFVLLFFGRLMSRSIPFVSTM